MSSNPNKTRGRGRPAFDPSDKQRGMVQALSQAGYDQDKIAEYLGVDPKTLRKHFARELDFASMELIAGAVTSLGRAAVGAKAQYDEDGNKVRDEVKPEAWAVCFLLKTKGKALGFSERHEHTGADGKDLFAGLDLTKLTDTRFNLLKELLRDAGAAIPD